MTAKLMIAAHVLRRESFPSPLGIQTLLWATAVCTGSCIGSVFSVTCGGTMSCPIKVVILVLSKHANGLLLEAAVEFPWARRDVISLTGLKHTWPDTVEKLRGTSALMILSLLNHVQLPEHAVKPLQQNQSMKMPEPKTKHLKACLAFYVASLWCYWYSTWVVYDKYSLILFKHSWEQCGVVTFKEAGAVFFLTKVSFNTDHWLLDKPDCWPLHTLLPEDLNGIYLKLKQSFQNSCTAP